MPRKQIACNILSITCSPSSDYTSDKGCKYTSNILRFVQYTPSDQVRWTFQESGHVRSTDGGKHRRSLFQEGQIHASQRLLNNSISQSNLEIFLIFSPSVDRTRPDSRNVHPTQMGCIVYKCQCRTNKKLKNLLFSLALEKHIYRDLGSVRQLY